MSHHELIFVDGVWRPSTGAEMIEVLSSVDGAAVGRVPAGTTADIDAAVDAAHAAFPAWAATDASSRAEYCAAIAAGLQERAEEIATTVTHETGMPKWLSEMIQVGLPVYGFTAAAELAHLADEEESIGNSVVIKQPVGVVGCITPWNYPLHQIAAKVAFAIAAGCTVVVKPSEIAPLDAYILAEVVEAAGLPRGVFNLVPGRGTTTGEALALHADVDMISFTGSTRAGRRVAELASTTVKRVSLELGGKSASVVMDDLDTADFERAILDAVQNCCLNSGQSCAALSRIVVPADRMSEAADVAASAVERQFRPSDPFEEGAQLGPLASLAQLERVRRYIGAGLEDGARLVTGGPTLPDRVPPSGYYVRPTVFADVTNDMRIAREEIFGPVISLIAHHGEDDAINIANDSEYGLGGAVWSADAERANRVARQLRTGQVLVNGGAFNPGAPFGGMKGSGYGRENGRYGLEEFLTTKSMQY